MKAGMSLVELATELQARRDREVDYTVDSAEIRMLTTDAGTEAMLIPQGPAKGGESVTLAPTDLFHNQLATHLGVRAELYDRLRTKHPPLFDHLINGLLDREPSKQLVRTYADGGPDGEGVARCLLSDRYRRIDNWPLAQSILPVIAEIPGYEIASCEVTEKKLYLKVVIPSIAIDLNEFRQGPEFEALREEYGPHHMFKDGEGPDFVQPGFVVQNSEVGAGALTVSQLVFRVRCSNGLIVEKAISRRHVGTRIGGEDGEDWLAYKDDTIIAADHALMLRVRDAISSTVDETKFDLLARQFASAGLTRPMAAPVEGMKVLAKTIGLTEGESGNVLLHLIEGGDLTKFGAINAVTRAAHDVESYDRSTELEELGSLVLAMPNSEWNQIAVAA